MGLRMDMHTPSVAPASQDTSSSSTQESKSVYDLIAEKDKVEAELTALGGVLDSVSLGIPLATRVKVPGQLTKTAWSRHADQPDHT